MIYAWLAVFRTVDSVALAKLNFAELVELGDTLSDKGIVVWVGVCGEERATPVYPRSQRVVVFL